MKTQLIAITSLLSTLLITANCVDHKHDPQCQEILPGINGWSIDIGGDYTWISINTTPSPTYTGSTGGVVGKITYQTPWKFFGQARTVYDLGPLSSSVATSTFNEWYIEFVGGWDFPLWRDWTFTPYVGLGLDYLNTHLSAAGTATPIGLDYDTYYAIIGFDTHYAWKNFVVGTQFDAFPIFSQTVLVKETPGAFWELHSKTGFAVHVPMAYKIPNCLWNKDIWVELAPYYRYMPIGASTITSLGLNERNVNEWGFFFSFRFLISDAKTRCN